MAFLVPVGPRESAGPSVILVLTDNTKRFSSSKPELGSDRVIHILNPHPQFSQIVFVCWGGEIYWLAKLLGVLGTKPATGTTLL